MAKRKAVNPLVPPDPFRSDRWPNLFADAHKVEALLSYPEFQALLSDLQEQVEFRSYEIVHHIPLDADVVAGQNYNRGYISACESLIELRSDWDLWKEAHRK